MAGTTTSSTNPSAMVSASEVEAALAILGAHDHRVLHRGEVLDQKVRALEVYASQVLDPPAGRSPDGVRSWARQAGFLAGCTYAESFEVLRLTL